MLYVLPKDDIRSWLESLVEKYVLFVPTSRDGFEKYNGKELYLERKTKLSVKEFFLPPKEEILRYEEMPSAIPKKVLPPTQEVVVFGVRPCDAKGVTLMKKVFEVDEYFKARVLHTSLIGWLCQKPDEGCFCKKIGLDPFSGEGLDALVMEDEDKLFIKVFNEKGKRLIELSVAKEATEEEKALFFEKEAALKAEAELKPVLERWRKKDLMELYESELWNELSFPCINCGACTFVCPTCFCFDIQDEVVGRAGVRVRLWDSCMFPLYSQHASGHNPRKNPVARFRNRFMHKFKYFLDRYGEPLCVGCGRCIEVCSTDVNVLEVITKIE